MAEINTKQIAINECGGAENYYKELNALISDAQFFEMYMKRETKSSFQFSVAITQSCSLKAFEDLRKTWGRYKTDDETLESVFDDFLCLKRLINDLYSDNDEQCKLTKTEIETLVHYFEKYRELDLTNYVSDFIGCSRGCTFVIDKIYKIREELDGINYQALAKKYVKRCAPFYMKYFDDFSDRTTFVQIEECLSTDEFKKLCKTIHKLYPTVFPLDEPFLYMDKPTLAMTFLQGVVH